MSGKRKSCRKLLSLKIQLYNYMKQILNIMNMMSLYFSYCKIQPNSLIKNENGKK